MLLEEVGWLDTVAGIQAASDESVERKKTSAFILGTGSFGFLFLGLVAFLVSPTYQGSSTGVELIVAGTIGVVTGIFLVVAIFAVWFDKAWFE